MPIRMLRDWTDSITLEGVSAEGERLFIRLIMKADDYGRFHADPRLVRALCFPLNEGIKSESVRKWLEELGRVGLVFTYEAEKRPLLAIVNFGQRLKQSRAKFPPLPGESDDWMPTSGNFRELPGTSGLNRREENTEKKREGKALPRPTLAEIIEFCKNEHLPESDAQATFHKWEGNGWKNGTNPIKDWKATIRSWKASGYMPSQRTATNGGYKHPTSTQPPESHGLRQANVFDRNAPKPA